MSEELKRACDAYKKDKSYMMENNFLHYFPEYVEWLEEELEEAAAVIRQRGQVASVVGEDCSNAHKELQQMRQQLEQMKCELETAKATIANLRSQQRQYYTQPRKNHYDWDDALPEYDRDDR